MPTALKPLPSLPLNYLLVISWVLFFITPLVGGEEATSWTKAKFHRKYIQDEGLLDPEDWIIIFIIPLGAKYRTACTKAEDKVYFKEIGASPLGKDQGQSFKGRLMIQFQIGGRTRLKAALEGRAMKYRDIEKRFWVEWSDAPQKVAP